MRIPLFEVDAFTDRPFGGNPAAVCILPGPKEDGWLQAVAREMNLSMTAFLLENRGGFDLRWFTPKVKVDLCGHATLAAAYVLWHQNLAQSRDQILFSTKSGLLKAVRIIGDIQLDFPLEPEHRIEPPPNLAPALGVSPEYIGKNRFDFLVEVESEHVLRGMTPNFKLLATLPCRGIIVTSSSSDPRFDFLSRFFAPALGLDEDPVSGSPHCCLANFWQKRLGKSEFVAYQASARAGVVGITVAEGRVFLRGRAVMVAAGELQL